VNLPEVQREGRREERRLLLHGGQILWPRDLAAHRAGKLLAVGVDEARLAEARRVQLLKIAELMRTSRKLRLCRRTFSSRVPGSASMFANAGEFPVNRTIDLARAK